MMKFSKGILEEAERGTDFAEKMLENKEILYYNRIIEVFSKNF